MNDVTKVASSSATGGAPGWESPAAAETRSELIATDLGVGPQQQRDELLAQDLEDLAAIRAYKASMLADTANIVSLQKRGTKQSREAQVYT